MRKECGCSYAIFEMMNDELTDSLLRVVFTERVCCHVTFVSSLLSGYNPSLNVLFLPLLWKLDFVRFIHKRGLYSGCDEGGMWVSYAK